MGFLWASPRDLLYSLVPIVYPYCVRSKFAKRVGLMLCSSHKKIVIGKRRGENGYVYDIDCGDRFLGVYLFHNSLSCIH